MTDAKEVAVTASIDVGKNITKLVEKTGVWGMGRKMNKMAIEQIVSRCRLLEEDSEPDGWPAIQMKDITLMCNAIEKMSEALQQIKAMAMDHPCFSKLHFDMKDIDDLVTIGGDICDWTMVAIGAEDGLWPFLPTKFRRKDEAE